VLHRRGIPRLAKHAGQRVETQFAPQLIERPDIAQGQRGLELDLRRCARRGRQPLGAQQAAKQSIDTAAGLIEAAMVATVRWRGLPSSLR